jgi:hypothetical protein
MRNSVCLFINLVILTCADTWCVCVCTCVLCCTCVPCMYKRKQVAVYGILHVSLMVESACGHPLSDTNTSTQFHVAYVLRKILPSTCCIISCRLWLTLDCAVLAFTCCVTSLAFHIAVESAWVVVRLLTYSLITAGLFDFLWLCFHCILLSLHMSYTPALKSYPFFLHHYHHFTSEVHEIWKYASYTIVRATCDPLAEGVMSLFYI